ncbi:MAG TPA: hypothetical protein ENJ09_06730 [Planctomycetes bacterium]|nr:hypothetical protein [Planctomycetota bacterium]
MLFSAPNIHHRLSIFGRFSEEHPWLITHAVGGAAGEVQVWGIDCTELPRGLTHIEGSTVVVEVPPPHPLGRMELDSHQRVYIPVYASEAEAPDPAERLRSLAMHLLDRMPDALSRDIPGASIEIRVLPEVPRPEDP